MTTATQHRYIAVSTLVFALVAAVQLVRALAGWPVRIGAVDVPVFASVLVAGVAAALALWVWRSR